GNFLSCHTPDMGFAVYRIDSQQKMFSTTLFIPPVGEARRIRPPTLLPVSVPLNIKTAFSAPFGFVVADNFELLSNRSLTTLPVWYSPDEKFLVAGGFGEFLRLDLSTLKKEDLPVPVRNLFPQIAGVLSNDLVLA